MITTSSIFLKTLAQAGITHAFVNWGSDHPALLEDLERQRVEGGDTAPKIVTCPNEMVALSAAQGYAQVTGKPAVVIVHTDVGTQVISPTNCTVFSFTYHSLLGSCGCHSQC
jgi:thiamine pyrophosphate-dependent acetolactate synthase large subunit-like protein